LKHLKTWESKDRWTMAAGLLCLITGLVGYLGSAPAASAKKGSASRTLQLHLEGRLPLPPGELNQPLMSLNFPEIPLTVPLPSEQAVNWSDQLICSKVPSYCLIEATDSKATFVLPKILLSRDDNALSGEFSQELTWRLRSSPQAREPNSPLLRTVESDPKP